VIPLGIFAGLVTGLMTGCAAILALRTGRIFGRFGFHDRSREPSSYWTAVVLYALVSLALILASLYVLWDWSKA
jgi:hypothetical protein